MKRFFLRIAPLFLVLGLSGCRLGIFLVEGGSVDSLSSGTCEITALPGGTICIQEVTDTSFSETYTAVPDPGWVFKEWYEGANFLCGGSTSPICELSNVPFAGVPEAEDFVASPALLFIWPMFEPVVIGTHNLAADWSDASNPNGLWSLKRNSSNISTHVNAWNGGAFVGGPQPAWVINDNIAQVPNFFKRVADGGSYDLPAGTTAGHAPGAGMGTSKVVWTSDETGTVQVTGEIWYASSLGRSVQWGLYLNGSSLSVGGIVSDGDPYSSSSPLEFSADGLSITPGDTIALHLWAPGGQQWGDVVGFDLTIADDI